MAADRTKLSETTRLTSNADEFGREPIGGGRQHALADPGALEEPGKSRHDRERRRDLPDALGQECGAGNLDRPLPGEGRQRVRALAERRLHPASQHHRDPDGDDDERRDVRVARRLDCEPCDAVADERRRDDRSGNRDNERRAGRSERRGDHAAQHDELALGEIDNVGGVVDDRKA